MWCLNHLHVTDRQSQTVFPLLHFNKISQISRSFSGSIVCRCPHRKVPVSSSVWLCGPGGACCPPTPGLRDSVTALMRSGPDILSKHHCSLLPISPHFFLFPIHSNDGRKVVAPGKLWAELLMGHWVCLVRCYREGWSCVTSVKA